MNIEEIIKKIEHGKFPMSAQNASDYARGYNVGIEDAVEVVEECLNSDPLHPQMEWVKVEDRLPEHENRVMVVWSDGSYDMQRHYRLDRPKAYKRGWDNDKQYDANGNEYHDLVITHWCEFTPFTPKMRR